MKNSTTNTESNQASTTNEETNDLGVVTVTPEDLGYGEPVTPPVEAAKPTEPVKPVEAPVTGYTKPATPAEPKKEEPATPPAAEPKKEEPAASDEEKTKKEIETAISTLGDGYDKSKITEFAVKNKFTKEQVDAYVAQIKADDVASTKAREEKVAAQRQSWVDDLAKDVEFGGENFDKSIHEVENLVEKYFTNTKKVLTEKKGMLPPYFMKDLLAVAKALKPTNKFEGGEPPAPAEESDSFLDDMYS